MNEKSPNTEPQKNIANWRGLGLRSVVAVILIPVVLLLTWAGGVWFEALMAAIGVLIGLEWAAMVHQGNDRQRWIHLASAVLAALAANHFGLWGALIAIGLSWLCSVVLLRLDKNPVTLWALAGIPYICLPVAAMILVRAGGEHGLTAVIWIFAVVWLADTIAYFAGKSIGGPKLAPAISPNKTWAGLGGAVAGGILGSVLTAAFFGLGWLVVLAIIGGAFAVLEQLGDLFESAAKRHFGLKDSGSVIPGHGGVLDRVDGLIAVVVAALILGLLRGGTDAPATGLLVW